MKNVFKKSDMAWFHKHQIKPGLGLS